MRVAQKTIPFFLHRDNINILEEIKGEPHEFLRLLPDFTGFKYSGTVTYMASNTDVGSLEQGELTITPNSKDEYVENCFALVEDTALIVNAIPEVIEVDHSATDPTKKINITTNPADATITVASGSTSTATATMGTGASAGVLTITGVAEGSTIVTITTSKTNYATFKRTILVIVK